MVEVDEGLRRPQNPSQFFAGDDLAGVFQEINQDEEALLAQLDGGAVAAQLHPQGVQFIDTETPSIVRARGRRQNRTPFGGLRW